MDFELLYRKQFNRDGLAKYLNVTTTTIKRWEKTNKAPLAVVRLMQVLSNDLSHLGEEWKDFYFYNQRLYTPENEPVQAAHIRAIKYHRMTLDFLRSEKSKAVNQAEQYKINKLVKKPFKLVTL